MRRRLAEEYRYIQSERALRLSRGLREDSSGKIMPLEIMIVGRHNKQCEQDQLQPKTCCKRIRISGHLLVHDGQLMHFVGPLVRPPLADLQRVDGGLKRTA